MRIAMTKEAFNREISVFTSKKKLVICYVWRIELYGSETWTLTKLERKYLERSEIWCWRRMEKIRWSEKVTNEQVLAHIGEKKTLLNNVLHKKSQLDW